jgi:hypothetical protein
MTKDALYLTTGELARRWSTTKEALAQHRFHGKGPRYVKLNRRILYSLADVEQFEADRLIDPTNSKED